MNKNTLYIILILLLTFTTILSLYLLGAEVHKTEYYEGISQILCEIVESQNIIIDIQSGIITNITDLPKANITDINCSYYLEWDS